MTSPGATRVVSGELPCGGDPAGGGAGADLTACDLFTVLWEALADILGTAAAATLLRRAAKRAGARWPELAELTIARETLEYRYTVPPAWKEASPDPPEALCELARELWALLMDLTGSVIVNRLAKVPELRDRGIVPQQEKQA